ncbi:hypothetical protein U9M48_027107 [Paspalum notatum var. saurae]|uniref:Oleosin n=1 Tax=Paspalum notatum var. saurae TaxID=547442 RepID=A0AAQ3TVV4_PASNO
MATTSARAHASGLQDEPLRRMRGLDAKAALRASPRVSTVATAAVLVPLGAALLGASGLALAVTLTGLALAAPLLMLFSPVLVPAAVAMTLAVAGLLASGAHGVAGVSALAWAVRYFWRDGRRGHGTVTGMVVQPLDHGEKQQSGAGGPAAFVGHRPRDNDVPRT